MKRLRQVQLSSLARPYLVPAPALQAKTYATSLADRWILSPPQRLLLWGNDEKTGGGGGGGNGKSGKRGARWKERSGGNRRLSGRGLPLFFLPSQHPPRTLFRFFPAFFFFFLFSPLPIPLIENERGLCGGESTGYEIRVWHRNQNGG